MKWIFTLILSITLTASLGAGQSRAQVTGPTLELTPATKTAAIGETFPIAATINTNEDTISAVELHLTYDPTAIEIVNFTPGTMLPVILLPETHANGTISVVMGVEPTAPFGGTGVVGTWNVKILAAKQSSLQFATTTQVASIGKTTNALAGTVGSIITGAKPGDANGDNTVDGIDYVVWLTHYNQSVLGASNGDFNNNGVVDGIDYVVWLNNYGSL